MGVFPVKEMPDSSYLLLAVPRTFPALEEASSVGFLTSILPLLPGEFLTLHIYSILLHSTLCAQGTKSILFSSFVTTKSSADTANTLMRGGGITVLLTAIASVQGGC